MLLLKDTSCLIHSKLAIDKIIFNVFETNQGDKFFMIWNGLPFPYHIAMQILMVLNYYTLIEKNENRLGYIGTTTLSNVIKQDVQYQIGNSLFEFWKNNQLLTVENNKIEGIVFTVLKQLNDKTTTKTVLYENNFINKDLVAWYTGNNEYKFWRPINGYFSDIVFGIYQTLEKESNHFSKVTEMLNKLRNEYTLYPRSIFNTYKL